MPELAWGGTDALGAEELARAACWLGSMDADYYALFALAQAGLERLLARQMRDPASEFGVMACAWYDGMLAGFVAAFPAEQTFARRMQVLKALLAASPDPAAARRRLRDFDGAARKLPDGAYYLAKLYLDAPLRGRGLADRMLQRFVDEGRALGRMPCLHVRHDNAAAQALYRRHGFTVARDAAMSSGAYWLMQRERDSNGLA